MTADRIMGHVDHAHEDVISGWIANLSDPTRLESVIFEDASGKAVSFHAWHFRPDVCEWLKAEGRFGFVVPRSALCGLDGAVTVRNRLGVTLPNGSGVEIGRQAVVRTQPAVIFLHIPKTAGTSLRVAATAGLLPSERLFVYEAPFGLTLPELAALSMEQRRAARLVAGHAYYGIDRFLGMPARYVTFLREPMARLRSHAAHYAAAGTSFGSTGELLALASVVENGLIEEFDNLMVRSVAGLPAHVVPLGTVGEKDVELALYNIERHFAMVGTVETMEADLARLSAALGRPIRQPGRENVTGEHVGGIKGVDWNRVEHRNRFDRMLYDRVRATVPRPVPDERPVALLPSSFGVAA